MLLSLATTSPLWFATAGLMASTPFVPPFTTRLEGEAEGEPMSTAGCDETDNLVELDLCLGDDSLELELATDEGDATFFGILDGPLLSLSLSGVAPLSAAALFRGGVSLLEEESREAALWRWVAVGSADQGLPAGFDKPDELEPDDVAGLLLRRTPSSGNAVSLCTICSELS